MRQLELGRARRLGIADLERLAIENDPAGNIVPVDGQEGGVHEFGRGAVAARPQMHPVPFDQSKAGIA